jgi:hypothetical protein
MSSSEWLVIRSQFDTLHSDQSRQDARMPR